MTTSTDQHPTATFVPRNVTASQSNLHMFGAPSVAVANLTSAAPAMPAEPAEPAEPAAHALDAAPAICAVATWDAMAAVRPEFGRIAASAHAWDTNGGAPSFQAYLCTGTKPSVKTLNVKTLDVKTLNVKTTAVKTVMVKTNKRPQSWSGPPNG